jgi:hypothetical protein
MGYTGFTKSIINTVIKTYNSKTVIDLGSQQDYDQPNLPAPYISGWYEAEGIAYECIDLNGENYAYILDLGYPLPEDFLTGRPSNVSRYCDLVVDAGTSEHVGRNSAFSWEAIYNCWLNKHNLLKIGGTMVNENPKTGNWPGHGFNYYAKEFYRALEGVTDYHVILLDEHPAMENRSDGWNVVCVMQKKSDRFPTLEEFKELGIQFS